MPRASYTPRHPAQLAASGFAAEDWRLLTKLPAEVMIATISLRDDGPRRTVAEGLAGLDAIAAGRWSDSDLVRAVVAAIYAEPEEDPPPADLAAAEDPLGKRTRVLAHCRRVVRILRAGADPADSAAYRHWVEQVAVRVCRASRTAGGAEQPELGGFLDELGSALS